MEYDIILRKVKSGKFKNDPLIVYRDPNKFMGIKQIVCCDNNGHSEMNYDYYLNNTVSASQVECQHLLDCLFTKEETYKVYKKFKF